MSGGNPPPIENKTFPPDQLAKVLYCLAKHVKEGGFDPAQADNAYYRIKYWFGIHDPDVDKKNELHLLIIHKGGNVASLYELIIQKKDDHDHYFVANAGIFKKVKDRFELEEAFGGLATYRRLQSLVDDISKQEELRILKDQIKESSATFEFD